MVASSIAGIDISKTHLDVYLLPQGRERRFSAAELPELVKWLKDHEVTLTVAEATGGLEVKLIQSCRAEGLVLSVVNPRHVRHFARSLGLLAKTDRLDARALALSGERVRPAPSEPPDADRQRLAALLRRRRQLIAMRTAERQRWHQEREPDLRAEIVSSIEQLDGQVRALERRIARHLRESPKLAGSAQCLNSIPGVGPTLTATLLAALPELGQASRKQVAALAGLAPYACESRAMKGRRRIWGGRAELRHALFMGALAAISREGPLRRRYLALVEAGKPGKVALVAVMRHMIVAANAMLRDGTTYQPS